MLQELRIQNFAIIDDLSVEFKNGFLTITGETGAGKSILVDAVGLLLGERSDSSMVRGGADRAIIEGTFIIPERLQDEINALLEAEGLEGETPHEIVLSREVRATGRSQARINGSPCNLRIYREVGGLLVDIHGQSEHLSLLRPAQHLYLLDRYANLEELRTQVGVVYVQIVQVRDEIDALLTNEAALARRIDMLQFQIEEIRAADLRPEEEDELQQERNQLVNAERIADMATEAQYLLTGELGEASGVEDLLAQAAIVLTKLAQLDPAADEHAQLAEVISTQSSELSSAVRYYREAIEFDPARLDQIEERIEILTGLKRKYGGTIEAVLAFADNAQRELDAITHSEERLAELHVAEDRLLHAMGQLASTLSVKRQEAGARLNEEIVRELGDLRMQDARFQVQIAQNDNPDTGCYVGERRVAFTHTGIDRVEFFLSANIGEPLRPLAKVASGGETARIMLALKGVLSYADRTPTLIFDEVDQGIGGRMGSVIGQKLWQLSDHHQVLCVTHLAQLAGYGDAHYRVSKHVENQRTVTRVEQLNDHGRVEELAEMLGAETTSARQSAYDILMLARRAKEGRRFETV